jgi:hypothetical protein
MERWDEANAIVATIDPQQLSTSGATTSTVAATTDVIDMKDFQEVSFVMKSGTITAGGAQLTIYSGSASGTVTTTVKAGTRIVEASDNDQQVLSVKAADLTSGHRYIVGILVVSPTAPATSATGLYDVTAIGSKPRFHPASDNDLASVIQIERA